MNEERLKCGLYAMNEERLESGSAIKLKFVHVRVRALCLQGCAQLHTLWCAQLHTLWCAQLHTLFTGQREIKRELLFLFLKGMMGALAPFRYIVVI